MLAISFAEKKPASAWALTLAQGPVLGPQAQNLDKKLGGAIAKALKAAPSFKGEKGQSLTLLAPHKGIERLVLLGFGKARQADGLAFEEAGGALVATLKDAEEVQLIIDAPKGTELAPALAGAHAALGARLRSYRFEKYQNKKRDGKRLRHLYVACDDSAAAKKAFAPLDKLSSGIFFTRDLVSEPPNLLDPEAMMKAARELEPLGLTIEVLDKKRMEKLGMGCLLGVAQGSDKPPFLVAVSWQGDPKAKDQRPVAFVGKGVTFDTGGISLKTPLGMHEMKFDMAGAAAVLGAMKTLALRKAKANVVGVVGLVENMPSGHAMRPGDVVTSAAGKTVEILNTDAEGRLVLADALWYAQDRFKPRLIIDLATLTGAMLISLGREYAGLFSNDDELAEQLLKTGIKTAEPLWRLPMNKAYDRMIESTVADIKNHAGRDAGSATAACFLGRFIEKGTAWAHLDIAWMVWADKDVPRAGKGATGYGVRLLDRFVADFCETQ